MDHMKLYEKQKVIGKGSYGKAYLVKSTVNHRNYVIKAITTSDSAKSKEDNNRWLEEIKILQACKHINVIKYKDCFITSQGFESSGGDMMVYIVMEYADSGDLANLIKRQRDETKGHFVESQVRNWLVQLSLALQYLHTKVRVMHRDIKPQNIFMTSTHLLKLGDFGVSKILSPGIDFASTQIGTPINLCPEIVNGKVYDFKSDIWGLGCVIHEICSLRHPFQSNSFNETMLKITSGNYDPIPSSYSTTLSDLIRVMLKVDPSRRPTAYQLATCQALKEDLEKQLELIKNLPSSSRSSDASSEGGTKNSCSSMGSGEANSSSGVYSGELKQ